MLICEVIGNLTRDPESRIVKINGEDRTVCTFTVAANRPGRDDAVFVRVSVWGRTGENCQKYLAKGRKVAVEGPVIANAYSAQDGTPMASLEVTAHDVEFLSSSNRGEDGEG